MAVLQLDFYHLAVAVVSLLTVALAYKLVIQPNFISSIRNIPGPPNTSLISGVLPGIFKAEPAALQDEWIKKYGPVIQYRGFMGQNRLYIADPKALHHILIGRPYDYPKPQQLRGQLARILGKGILFAEGDDHKRQRRLMNTPFTQSAVNTYQPMFQEEANKLRDRMLEEMDSTDPAPNGKGEKSDWKIHDPIPWLARATLDVIGHAGFAYDFGSLDKSGNQLAETFMKMLKPRQIKMWMIVMQMLMVPFPFLAKLPTKAARELRTSLRLMEEEGKRMLDIRKEWAENGELEDKKDLMSLMMKANMTGSAKDKISDVELMGQISTFILAGSETSATTLSWIMLRLSSRPEMQTRLRNEVREAKRQAYEAEGRNELSIEELSNLPFMDAIVRESLRYDSPVTMTIRGASQDDVIPLSSPQIGRDGRRITSVNVQKGQHVMLGITSLHKNTEIYGPDAAEFNPDRWLNKDSIGDLNLAKNFTTWSQILSFLGGPRGCIGYRFALLETKTILATIIDAFEFTEREPGIQFTKRSNIVCKPVVTGEEEEGSRLPLRMRRAPA